MWLFVACAAPTPVAASRPGPGDLDVPRGALAFRFPLEERALFQQTVGVDHDPEVHDAGLQGVQCTSYDGRSFPWCYDEHDGTDYLLDGGFDTMDEGSAVIVAAADGVVITTVDGNYDRCHATLEGVDCDGYPMAANYVEVEHEGGWITRYFHMMSGSPTVRPGDVVRCGDPLGLVGSSGYSSMPHLHFELQAAEGGVVDPYAGPYSQAETWWMDQGDAEGLPGSDCGG